MKRIKLLMHTYQLQFKLSVFSLLSTIFITHGGSKCGGQSFGLPLRFIRTYCGCPEHIIPIDFLYMGIDIIYHMIIWSVLIYLWKDTKETWQLLFKRKKI